MLASTIITLTGRKFDLKISFASLVYHLVVAQIKISKIPFREYFLAFRVLTYGLLKPNGLCQKCEEMKRTWILVIFGINRLVSKGRILTP